MEQLPDAYKYAMIHGTAALLFIVWALLAFGKGRR